MDIRFGDHSSFHRAAAGMVGASAVLGLASHPLTSPMAPVAAGLLGIAIGASLGYGQAKWRIAATSAACIPLFVMTPSWPILALVSATTALGIAAYGLRGIRGAFAVMLGAVVTMLAIWSAWRVGHAQQTMTWPSWARDMTSSAAMGMIGVIAMLPRHLKLSLDPVQAAIRGLPSDLDGEVRELCNRSISIWSNAKDKLGETDPGTNLVRDGVLKTLEVATKSSEVKVNGATEQELAKRIADLDQRITSATDAEVKTQYQSARAALEDQRRYREHIKQNQDRLVARMHNHVAALEKFQMAASGLAAARAATAGATAVKQLEELSHDVAASGEALAELELAGSPEPMEAPAVTADIPAEVTPAQA